ncbi:MAG: Rne/Rng family ribonuclease [Saprospiraceae bacterium]|nr:Rne/Rng family ribonuclease [Saprospiraceae bacterium]
MEKELIINSTPTQVEIALSEDSRLVELHREKTNSKFTVGDIFLGRIKKLMPGLNAAFVEIGHPKDAFLHYTDLGPKLPSLLKFTNMAINGETKSYGLESFNLNEEIIKTGKIDQVLNKRHSILVQILKEPISTKGPRLSCEITLPGRFLVLTPFSNIVSVSKKINSAEERKRLQVLIESIKPRNFGIIVRTAAEGKKVAHLHEEIRDLEQKWKRIHEQLKNAKAPLKLLSELDKTSSMLRDVLTDDFSNIVVNDRDMYDSIRGYLSANVPEKEKIVHLHKSSKPLFDAFGITRQIKSSFGKTYTLPSGAYLVIEHTEAMHVIDVNSGPKMARKNQDDAVLNVNVESALEIARQLRLRDIGGLIIVDFIDMRSSDHKKILVKRMREFMEQDRAQHTVLPLSRFGLMQITRQRARPEVKIDTTEVCPTCQGSGKINASVLIIEEIERDLEYVIQNRPKTKLSLFVHPYIYAYLKHGLPSRRMKWYFQYQRWVRLFEQTDFHINEYRFYDGRNDEIRLT